MDDCRCPIPKMWNYDPIMVVHSDGLHHIVMTTWQYLMLSAIFKGIFHSWKCRSNNYFWLWKWSSHKRRFPRHQMKVSACFVLPWLMGGGRFWRPVKQISGDSSSPGITVLGSRRSLFSRKMWKCVEDDKVVIKFR